MSEENRPEEDPKWRPLNQALSDEIDVMTQEVTRKSAVYASNWEQLASKISNTQVPIANPAALTLVLQRLDLFEAEIVLQMRQQTALLQRLVDKAYNKTA